MLTLYKKYISPIYHSIGQSIFGNAFACRFTPSCSVYAKQAIKEHGIIFGLVLSIYRILRCQPLSKGGYDPVPPRHKTAC